MIANMEALREQMLPLRHQADLRNMWLKQRLDTFLPELMAREGFDMWIVEAREYNEDPVIMTLLPEPAMAARRRTILVFSRQPDGNLERITIDRYGFQDFYTRAWEPDNESQFECLARLVRERNPATIGLNISQNFAFGDGLTYYEFTEIDLALGADMMQRTRSAERLCLGWLEHRIPLEWAVYPSIIAMGHGLISEAYSHRLIEPGVTTTDDVVWWFRQTMHDLGLRAWFQPTVEIQAPGQRFDDEEKRKVIQPGDLLHCDVGFYYLGLATDQQQHAYIPKPGESDAPQGLKLALCEGNRLQDILLEEMQVGRSGNEVLQTALQRASAEGLNPQIYTHALGYHGHAAGPTIGLWDQQQGVPGKGDYELFDETAYAIELNIKKAVSEWGGQEVRIALEEDAALRGGVMGWLDGRQEALFLI
jgi:peptidase M24-like protein